jgi:hypothetical protein
MKFYVHLSAPVPSTSHTNITLLHSIVLNILVESLSYEAPEYAVLFSSCYFFLLAPRYSPHRPVTKYIQTSFDDVKYQVLYSYKTSGEIKISAVVSVFMKLFILKNVT